MKNIENKLVLVLMLICISFYACDDNDNPPNGDDNNNEEPIPLVFDSLTADKDTILAGEAVEITAIASGKEISYSWEASSGNILGSGSTITLTTPPCIPDEITVSCRVTDDYDESDSKSIVIVVQ
jgi:hypothetical protein